jgi:2-oxoglutarate ferredoxin oxidoreductase subunit alpha
MAIELIEGNAAIAEAAIRAGVEAFFGYPITPQTEVLEHFSRRMEEEGRIFLQAESEIASINMVYGAACAGARVMTSSSSPGISLMQEGLSYIACSEVPVVVVNIMRGGPGLGNVQPAQSDYFQAVKGAGHGDFHMIVLAPASVQEAVDLMVLAFDLAEKYRTLVMVVADGIIGQMMEPAEMPDFRPVRKFEDRGDWALTGAADREPNIISSLYLGAENLERVNLRLQAKLAKIAEAEQRWDEYETEDADILLVGFGTMGRVCQSAAREARAQGMKVGVFRPVSLWPFPSPRLSELADQVEGMLVVEMNAGQMIEDVRLAVGDRCAVGFHGRTGGIVPLADDVFPELEAFAAELIGQKEGVA